MEPLLDISIFRPKAKPKVDRAANAIAMRNTRDEIAAARFVYDEEEDQLPDSAVIPPVAANENVAGDNVAAGNKPRTIKSFHRLWTQRSFHRTSEAMNNELKAVGERYRRSFFAAGGTDSSPPPAYHKPVDSYDDYRQVPIVPVDKCLPYQGAERYSMRWKSAKLWKRSSCIAVRLLVSESNTAVTPRTTKPGAPRSQRCGLGYLL